jgi:hypothetical protein
MRGRLWTWPALTLAGALLLIAPPVYAQSSAVQVAEEWAYIMEVAADYIYASEQQHNLGSIVFAGIFADIATTSYNAGTPYGQAPTQARWAGPLVRSALLHAARDIARRPRYWNGIDHTEAVDACEYAVGVAQLEGLSVVADLLSPEGLLARLGDRLEQRIAICQGQAKGIAHFREHLEPWFEQFFGETVRITTQGVPNPVERATRVLRSHCFEHKAFLDAAVGPAFERREHLQTVGIVGAYWSQSMAAMLRYASVVSTLGEAYRAGAIDLSQAQSIAVNSGCLPLSR